ncbi:hypothetical protein FB451DRAFT_1408660 [Mycena latifolia]|nr:hypothetical protein FB451DRAFT_1408660 [Mycena latifolia]
MRVFYMRPHSDPIFNGDSESRGPEVNGCLLAVAVALTRLALDGVTAVAYFGPPVTEGARGTLTVRFGLMRLPSFLVLRALMPIDMQSRSNILAARPEPAYIAAARAAHARRGPHGPHYVYMRSHATISRPPSVRVAPANAPRAPLCAPPSLIRATSVYIVRRRRVRPGASTAHRSECPSCCAASSSYWLRALCPVSARKSTDGEEMECLMTSSANMFMTAGPTNGLARQIIGSPSAVIAAQCAYSWVETFNITTSIAIPSEIGGVYVHAGQRYLPTPDLSWDFWNHIHRIDPLLLLPGSRLIGSPLGNLNSPCTSPSAPCPSVSCIASLSHASSLRDMPVAERSQLGASHPNASELPHTAWRADAEVDGFLGDAALDALRVSLDSEPMSTPSA